ncbi:hypothetical protein IFO70_31930 [Phormidium tenue FACHB-886]|nr:hypothetical protein [Phormidium tenue FACHB-886]
MHSLFAAIAQTPVQGQFVLPLQRTSRRAARVASLSVRYTQLWLQPPAEKQHLPAIVVSMILAQEEAPPAGSVVSSWVLLTTLPAVDLAAARQCLEWYACR